MSRMKITASSAQWSLSHSRQSLRCGRETLSRRDAQRLVLRPVRAPSACIDYVIAHEICHLKFPRHDQAFYGLLTQVCPNWRMVKERLEESLS